MKKIISGKRYDTDKGIEIGHYDNLHDGASSTTDFKYWEGTLYRTPRSGKYFLAGEGGPMSRFGRVVDQNSMGGGSDIIPMSREDAFEWAQNYLDAETVEEHFGDMIEDA